MKMMGFKERAFTPKVCLSLEELVPQDHFYRHLERTGLRQPPVTLVLSKRNALRVIRGGRCIGPSMPATSNA